MKIEYNDFLSIRTKKQNKFKGFNCYYLSKNYVEINVSHKGYINFGPCFTLDRLRYSINELPLLLVSEKSILCSEKACDCGINIKKEKSDKYIFILKIESKIGELIKKYLPTFELIDISISLKKNIIIRLKFNDHFIFYQIEKSIENKQLINKDGLGYSYNIKNIQNIIIKSSKIDESFLEFINKGLLVISKFDSVYKLIILKDEI